jgi:HEPN domain-containing protein
MIDKETKNWLIKAINDYKTAEKLINLPENEIITDTLCFHCQQAVEKLLKAFLVYHKIGFQKVHTIEEARNAFESATFVKEFIFKKLNITEKDIL